MVHELVAWPVVVAELCILLHVDTATVIVFEDEHLGAFHLRHKPSPLYDVKTRVKKVKNTFAAVMFVKLSDLVAKRTVTYWIWQLCFSYVLCDFVISTASNHAQLNNIVLAQRNLYRKCNVRCTCVHVPMNLCFNDVSSVCVILKNSTLQAYTP